MAQTAIVLFLSIITTCTCPAEITISETGLWSVTASVSYWHEDPDRPGRTYHAGAGSVYFWMVGSMPLLTVDAEGHPAGCRWTVVAPSDTVYRNVYNCPSSWLFQDGFESGNVNAWTTWR